MEEKSRGADCFSMQSFLSLRLLSFVGDKRFLFAIHLISPQDMFECCHFHFLYICNGQL